MCIRDSLLIVKHKDALIDEYRIERRRRTSTDYILLDALPPARNKLETLVSVILVHQRTELLRNITVYNKLLSQLSILVQSQFL